MPSIIHARAGRIIALAFFAFTLATQATFGQEQRIDVTRSGVTTTLVLPEYKSQGVPYASIADVARQLGGTTEVDAARAAIQINEVRAEVGLNDVAVRRGDKAFSLVHPVLPYQNDALIAMSDVARLLREGYGIGTPEDPPADSALALPAEEAPLESVSPAPDTAAMPAEATLEETPLESVDTATEVLEEAPLESVVPAEATDPGTLPAPAFGNSATLVVAIDAGHGGEDAGIVGPSGLMEKDVCLAVATALRRVLTEQYGITTIMTRESDEARTPQRRMDAASGGNAALVISIHGGASYATEAMGPVVFAHAAPRSLRNDPKPALKIAGALADSMTIVSAPAEASVHEVSLGLLRASKVPGVLVELGNLMNPVEETRLADPHYQEQLAAALAAGLNQALGRPEPAGAAQ